MDTICILIGNSDNKLTQNEWAHFVSGLKRAIEEMVWRVHFFGGSETYAPWQNCCWVCEINPDKLEKLKAEITHQRKEYGQESAAVLIGETQFI